MSMRGEKARNRGELFPATLKPQQAGEMIKKSLFLAAFFAVASLTLASCGPKPAKQEHIAVVNGAPIGVDEFAREASMASDRYPEIAADPGSEEALSIVLDSMILKKLMIQEAAKMGLSEDKEFLNTIKMYWEQTLIKKLIDTRNEEFAKTLSVSDEEAEAYYRRMGGKLTLLAIKAGSEEEAGHIAAGMGKGTRPEGAEVLGPLLIENLDAADPLASVFDMAEGDTTVIREEDGYLAVRILRRDTVQTPPFAALSAEIREALLERKKEQAFNDWLEDVKEAATIDINRGALERAVR